MALLGRQTPDRRVEATKEKIREFLSEEYNGVHEVDAGWIVIPGVGSTAVAVDVDSIFDGEHLKISVFAPLLIDVQISEELLAHVALSASRFHFGALRLLTDDERSGLLYFEYAMVGDSANKDEVKLACILVGAVADGLDNELQDQFGGRLFSD